MIKIENLKKPCMRYLAKVIPLAFDESMSYYEFLCSVYKYLKNEIVPVVNNNAEAIAELQEYLENLDLQDEVNNKLDAMYEEGKLQSIIEEFLSLNVTFTYDTVNDLKQATNLINGTYVETLGYHTMNDNGGAKYKVRTKEENEEADEMFTIALYDTTLVAEIIIEKNTLNIKQIGATGDEDTNDTSIIIAGCQSEYNVFFPEGIYQLDNQLIIKNASDKVISGAGINKTIISINDEIQGDITSYITTSYEETIHNFTFKNISVNMNTQLTTRYAISFMSINGLNIENVEIYNNKGYATRFNDSTNIKINNIYIHDCDGIDNKVGGGIYGTNMKNVQITNARIINCGDHAYYLNGGVGGTETIDSENIEINNSYCKNIGYDGYTAGGAITIYGNIKNITLNNCIVEDSAQGIHITKHGTELYTPSNITISNCVIKNSTEMGIYIEGLETDPVRNITIINNVIDTTNSSDGISLRVCDRINVNGNIIRECKRIGIEIINTDNSIINNNILQNNTGQLWCGTRNSTHCNNNLISNNTIYCTDEFKLNNPTGSGLYVISPATNTVTSNNNCYNHGNYNYVIRGATNKSLLQSINGTGTFRKSIIYSDSIPTNYVDGEIGDICFNTNVTAGGNIGWVCVESGTPGTWKSFGDISS